MKQPFDRHNDPYVFVVIRADLTPAQQGVQACHAAMAATHDFQELPSHTRLVMVTAQDQEHLLRLADKLEAKGAPCRLFEEPDHGIGFSAFATAPRPHATWKMLHALPLWSPAPA
jgi:hypothetical protein